MKFKRHQRLKVTIRSYANFLAISAPLRWTSACRMLVILKKEQNAIKLNYCTVVTKFMGHLGMCPILIILQFFGRITVKMNDETM